MLRRLRHAFALVFAASLLPAVASAANPRQLRIALSDRVTMARVQEAGLDIVNARPGLSVDVLEWPGDGAAIAALGAEVTLVDDDPGLHAAQRARAELRSRPVTPARRVRSATRPDGVFRVETLPPPGSGSLGGFWTLAQVKMKLDDLVASDTRDLVADKLDTLGYTVQGRPIWGLKIAKAVEGADTRPVAYFSSITHAREPGGMQALFNFADDVLGKYDADPSARYLLENRQIYICPVANPDGYWYNQRIYDSTATFGFWRKNLRDNNGNGATDNGDGVDINRNYGYKWGINSTGSSGTASSAIYRGPSAWSEPETRVQRDAFSALHAVAGFSFHTYSDLFVHPWGWTTAGTPDSARFQTWSDEFTITNGFVGGPGPRILYAVNGEFSDWTYGDTLLKAKAFTWTPEVGSSSDGFWPPPSRMAAINETVLRPCWQVAGIAGPWVRVEKTSLPGGYINAGAPGSVAIRARNVGAGGQAGPGLTGTLTTLDPGIQVVQGTATYPTLGSFESADADGGGTFMVLAADSVTAGRMVRLQIDFTDIAGLYCRDTIEVVIGTPTVLALDACQSLSPGWTRGNGTWGTVTSDAGHPDAYIADSPAGSYASNLNAQLWLNGSFDLSKGVHAWAFFEDRYAFEQEFDAGLFEASFDTTAWTALPGNGAVTTTSASIAGSGLNVFGGTRWRWREDRVDLSAFAGNPLKQQVWLRWRSRADGGTNFDGMNFDSLRICVYDPALQPVATAVGPGPVPARLHLSPPSPNPARGPVTFAFEAPEAGPITMDVLDVQGRVIQSRTTDIARGGASGPYASRFTWGWDLRDRAGRAVAAGLYLVRLHSAHEEAVARVVVLP